MSNGKTTTTNKIASDEIVAVIVGALSALGYSAEQIAHIRPVVAPNWRMAGRLNSAK